MIYEKKQELYVMMFTMQSLHYKGILIKDTVSQSLGNLLGWYRQSGNRKYLEVALLQMQAYANMGFSVDDREPAVREILKLTGKNKENFIPQGIVTGKRIKVTKNQIRNILGRWRSGRNNSMKVNEVADDIFDKLEHHKIGRYIYENHRNTAEEPDIYELVINEEESYFFDVRTFRFYMFEKEKKDDQNCDCR